MSSPNSKLGPVHWNGLEGVGSWASWSAQKERCCSRRGNKAKDGRRERESGGRESSAKIKSREWRNRPAPAAPGHWDWRLMLCLQPGLLGPCPAPGHAESTGVLWFFFPFLKKRPPAWPYLRSNCRVSRGWNETIRREFPDFCEFFSRSGRESVWGTVTHGVTCRAPPPFWNTLKSTSWLSNWGRKPVSLPVPSPQLSSPIVAKLEEIRNSVSSGNSYSSDRQKDWYWCSCFPLQN